MEAALLRARELLFNPLGLEEQPEILLPLSLDPLVPERLPVDGVGPVLIKDCEMLEKEIIPEYFSLTKLSSFIRQLHLYDFHKSKAKNFRSVEMAFCNPKFLLWDRY